MKVLSKYAYDFLFCVFIFSYNSSIIAEKKVFSYEVLGKTLKESILWLCVKEEYTTYGNYFNQFFIEKIKKNEKDYNEKILLHHIQNKDEFHQSDLECPKDRIKNHILKMVFESLFREYSYPIVDKVVNTITVKKKKVSVTNHFLFNENVEKKVPKQKQRDDALVFVEPNTMREKQIQNNNLDHSKIKPYNPSESYTNVIRWNNEKINYYNLYNRNNLQDPLRKLVSLCKTQQTVICKRKGKERSRIHIFDRYKIKRRLHPLYQKTLSTIENNIRSIYVPRFLEVNQVSDKQNLPLRSGVYREQRIDHHNMDARKLKKKKEDRHTCYVQIKDKEIVTKNGITSILDFVHKDDIIYTNHLKSLCIMYLYIFRSKETYINFRFARFLKNSDRNKKSRIINDNTDILKKEKKRAFNENCFYLKEQGKLHKSKDIPIYYNEKNGWASPEEPLLKISCTYMPKLEEKGQVVQELKKSSVNNVSAFTIKHETLVFLFFSSHKEFIKSMKKYVTDKINFSLYTDIISPEVYNCEKYKKIKWTLIFFFIPAWFLINIVYITLVHKIQRQILNPLHRLLIFPSVIRLSFYVLLLIFCVQCSDIQSNSVEYTLMGYMALNTMFHTIFYGNLLLISKGYMVIRDNFEKRESVSITLLICSIYIIISVNQVDMINTIPNILCLHILLLCILVNNIIAIIKFLKYRLAFIRDVGITTWEESIIVKLNMYKMFLRLVIFFFVSEIMLHVGSLFFNSMTTNWLILEHTLELFTWILVLYLCRYRGDVLYFSLLYNNSTLQILPLFIARNDILEVEQFCECSRKEFGTERKTINIRCRKKENKKKEKINKPREYNYNNKKKVLLSDQAPVMFLHPPEYEGQHTISRLVVGFPEKIQYKKVGLCTMKKIMVMYEMNPFIFEEPSEDLLIL